jgi:hypothetical protein
MHFCAKLHYKTPARTRVILQADNSAVICLRRERIYTERCTPVLDASEISCFDNGYQAYKNLMHLTTATKHKRRQHNAMDGG